MARQAARGKGRTWWELAKSGGFFTGAKLSRSGANHLRSRILAPVCARAATVLKASARRYPAGIWVNHEIVLDERY